MLKPTCPVCGDTFFTKSIQRRYCSDLCRSRGRRRIPCAECGAPTGWSTSQRKRAGSDPICNPCRVAASRERHGTTYCFQLGCRCDECRRVWNEKSAKYQRAARKAGRYAQGREPKRRECEVCGKALRSKGGAADGRSLCKPHRDEAIARRRRALARRERFRRMIAVAAAGTSGSAPFFQGTCMMCGESFTRKTSPSPFCSKRCSGRSRNNWISDVDRLAIYERDNWTCQLCFEPTSRAYRHDDNWSPTLDHIIPRSHQLVPDDSPSNLRTAHRWCNSVRGDLSYYTDEDLIGVVADASQAFREAA